MIIMIISIVVIVVGVIAIILGTWCLVSGRTEEYRRKREMFNKKKWQVQGYIDEHREKIKNGCN